MTKPKAYVRLYTGKAKQQGRHLLYRRWVRNTLYFLKNVSLPGNRGVPIYDVLRYILVSIFNGTLWQRSKGLAYSFLTAIPPLMIFLFTLIAFFPVDGLQNELLTELGGIIPEAIMGPLSNTINDVMGHRHGTLLSIGFASSILLAANGLMGVITSLNFANNSIEKRPYLQRYLISIVLVFVIYILIVLVLSLLIGHKYLLQLIFSQGWMNITKFNTLLFNVDTADTGHTASRIAHILLGASQKATRRFPIRWIGTSHAYVLCIKLGTWYLPQQFQPLQPFIRVDRHPADAHVLDIL